MTAFASPKKTATHAALTNGTSAVQANEIRFSLTGFGLNPNDWRLTRDIESNIVSFVHRLDRDLRLTAETLEMPDGRVVLRALYMHS